MKRFFLISIFFLFCGFVFAESNIEKFVKGNISEKTAAVKNAKGKEIYWLSDKAINFILESKEILGNDRELDGLAVATILAFPQEIISSSSSEENTLYLNSLIKLLEVFSDSPTVQTAIISKISSFKSFMSISPFIKVLNKYISDMNLNKVDSDVVNSILNLLASDGDNESFSICYYLWAEGKYPIYNNEIEKTIIALVPVSMSEAISIVNNSSFDVIIPFYNLLNENKSKINQKFFSELAVNLLSNTILLVKNSKGITSAVTDMQIQALTVLSENKWTRASSVVLSYFDYAKKLYENKELSADDFVLVIKALNNVSPLEAVSPLVSYLGNLNSMVERQQEVSESVVLAVINTLGAIGDKSAFDTLLGVTYYNYPQSVLSAAREALSGLKW